MYLLGNVYRRPFFEAERAEAGSGHAGRSVGVLTNGMNTQNLTTYQEANTTIYITYCTIHLFSHSICLSFLSFFSNKV
jgi:hypothetical protein